MIPELLAVLKPLAWRIGLGLVLAAVLTGGLMAYKVRGRRIETLELQAAGLKREIITLHDRNFRLVEEARVLVVAAEEMGQVCRAELVRRGKIEELAEARPAIKPESAIDSQTSRKSIDLLNNDLFAPLGNGLRRAAD
jgi:hypothetical protein